MGEEKEFALEEFPDLKFRLKYCSPVDILALNMQADFEKFKATKEIYTYALEHIEVCINNMWYPVKQKDRDVYMPIGVETQLAKLNALCLWFINNVLAQVFQSSDE